MNACSSTLLTRWSWSHLMRAAVAWGLVTAVSLSAAEVIPAPPQDHFNDYAGLVPANVAAQLNQQLAQFERDTSNQIVVAIYPRLQSDAPVSDYAVRVAQKWAVGQKGRKNGAVLFVFKESRDIWIATGYGLEGALPDALCKRIIEDEIAPRFRTGDFSGGLRAGVSAMMAATRGEYVGSGQNRRDAGSKARGGGGLAPIVIIVLFVLLSLTQARGRRNTVYGRGGRRTFWMGPPWGGGGWGGGGGSGWSGGSGGTFSGGGGSFGGGGAGGKW